MHLFFSLFFLLSDSLCKKGRKRAECSVCIAAALHADRSPASRFLCSNIIVLLLSSQRNYFSCKKQFDIRNLNSTYTQVRMKITCAMKKYWIVIECACLYFSPLFLKTEPVFVHPQMESRGLYKAMGELDILFNYIETYLASKRQRN